MRTVQCIGNCPLKLRVVELPRVLHQVLAHDGGKSASFLSPCLAIKLANLVIVEFKSHGGFLLLVVIGLFAGLLDLSGPVPFLNVGGAGTGQALRPRLL